MKKRRGTNLICEYCDVMNATLFRTCDTIKSMFPSSWQEMVSDKYTVFNIQPLWSQYEIEKMEHLWGQCCSPQPPQLLLSRPKGQPWNQTLPCYNIKIYNQKLYKGHVIQTLMNLSKKSLLLKTCTPGNNFWFQERSLLDTGTFDEGYFGFLQGS